MGKLNMKMMAGAVVGGLAGQAAGYLGGKAWNAAKNWYQNRQSTGSGGAGFGHGPQRSRNIPRENGEQPNVTLANEKIGSLAAVIGGPILSTPPLGTLSNFDLKKKAKEACAGLCEKMIGNAKQEAKERIAAKMSKIPDVARNQLLDRYDVVVVNSTEELKQHMPNGELPKGCPPGMDIKDFQGVVVPPAGPGEKGKLVLGPECQDPNKYAAMALNQQPDGSLLSDAPAFAEAYGDPTEKAMLGKLGPTAQMGQEEAFAVAASQKWADPEGFKAQCPKPDKALDKLLPAEEPASNLVPDSMFA